MAACCAGALDADPPRAGARRLRQLTEPQPPAPTLTGAQAHAPAPETAGALALIADGPAARRRLGYVDPDRLANTGLPVRDVSMSVLGTTTDAPAIRVGNDVTAVADGPPPETSAITPAAPSAVQSCLGNAVAQTILGMGDDAAIGVGLTDSGEGVQLRVCGAPHYVRHLDVMERALVRAGADATEVEIGEREIVAGVLPVDACGCSPAAASCARSPGADVHGAITTAPRRSDRVPFMRKTKTAAFAAAILAAATGVAVGQSAPDKTAQLAAKIDASKPKNVILLVGDGMGYSEVTLGRYYGKGATGRLNMDRLAFRGSSIHYVLRPGPARPISPTTSVTRRRRRPRGQPASARRTAGSPRARPRPTTSPARTPATRPTWSSPATPARPPATSRRRRSPTRRRPRRARTSPSVHARARTTRARPARRRPRRPRSPASARSPSSRSTRASTSTWAAGARGTRSR